MGRPRALHKTQSAAALFFLLPWFGGCGTMVSIIQPMVDSSVRFEGPYSGAKLDADSLGEGSRDGDYLTVGVSAIDLPISMALDTALLPITMWFY